jgi:tetratricopeptide (TPR) repeat protein
MAEDLEKLDDEGKLRPVKRLLTGRMLAATAGLVVALLAGTWWLATSRAPEEQPDPMSILIADIDNQTRDETFNGAVEQALNIAMEGAGFISSYSRPKAQKVASQLLPDSTLDSTMARLVSRREGIDVVLASSIAEKGSGYRITIRALDAAAESEEAEPLATIRESARSKEDVLPAVGRLASDLRRKLGDTVPESARMAAAETFTAASLEAMSAYAEGQALSVQGQFLEALESYKRAVEEDPEFGRAYAGMGVVYGNLRRPDEAEESYQNALKYVDRMSERERYRTLGGYYLLVSRNYPEAIASYEKLVELFPADGGGHSNLALSYLYERDFAKAVQEGKVAVDLDPGNMLKRMNYSMYAMYAGDFETSIAESQKVLEQNPSFGYAIFTAARSAAADGRLEEAGQMYEDLGDSDALGATLAPIGRADLALTSGLYSQAAAILEPLASLSEPSAESAPVLVMLAETELALGRSSAAAELASTAASLASQESVLYPAARILIAAADLEGAQQIAKTLEDQLQTQTVAYARLIQGEIALHEGRLLEAIEALRDGRERHDTWFAHFLLGKAYIEGEQFAEALGELEICLDRKGEIVDLFLLDSATLRYLPPVYYWLGRAQEGLGSTVPARSNYRIYLELRGNTEAPDPLAADASRRWSALEAPQTATG